MKLSILVFATLASLAVQAVAEVPKGWVKAGSKPAAYEFGTDRTVKRSGQASGFLKSKEATVDGFGTLMQTIGPAKFASKRLRLTAAVKADRVANWAGLWMRIDGDGPQPLGFDNMESRAIRGSSDWKSYDVVLDVPKGATAIAFGVLLSGTGTVWIDDVRLEAVSLSVPTTTTTRELPENLDFEES